MKEPYQIPECVKLFDEMFKEWNKIPRRQNAMCDMRYERMKREIEKEYLPRIIAIARKYNEEHPDE